MKQHKYTTASDEETKQLADQFVHEIFHPGMTVALIGDLGAGKTTFVQGVANALGIEQTITSPTFILFQEYAIEQPETGIETLYHLDLYRLETMQDVYELGLEEIVADEKGLVLIEWADKAKEVLPENALEIHFESSDENKRIIKLIS